jgi:hypothetical protein
MNPGRLLGILALLAFDGMAEPQDVALTAELEVKQKYLVPLCLNGVPVASGERRFRLAARTQTIAFTMRNQPREGWPGAVTAPGAATISFTPETGHEYEAEVRAPLDSFSFRVWKRGEWRPVVRDRTDDRIVSSEPEWSDAGCPP